ncbi:YeeE/YedE family protein [bacterium]|nr:YeeE/YedE family protein [bacterium]
MARQGASYGVGFVRKAPLHWAIGGLLIAAVVLVAECAHGPIELSAEFVAAGASGLDKVSPTYVNNHPLIKNANARQLGFGAWFILGTFAGAAGAAVATGRWRVRHTSAWWSSNHGGSKLKRYAFVFVGGALVMIGARLAHGCTSGHLLSGWAQLSAAAFPFTFSMIVCAMIVARLFHPEAPPIER